MTSKTILSSNGVHRLHHTFFIPKGEIIASLLIVHGMSEHSGRYEAFAKFLADNGVMVATYDQLGHGQTVKDKYELGFFDEKHPVQTLCKDVIIMADALKERAQKINKQAKAQVPHFIMGHSMGSFVVRTVLTHHATSFDGAILMGTGNASGLMHWLSAGYLAWQNQFRPKKHNKKLAKLINQYLLDKLPYAGYASAFAWLSYNKENVQNFESDPLCGFAFTNNGFYALNVFIKKATDPSWYENIKPSCALLLLGGKDDPVGNFGQDIKALQATLISQGKDCSAYVYANARHEILHEAVADKVHHEVLAWLKNQSKKSVIGLK